MCNPPKGPATRNDFVNDIVDDARAAAIFATLKTIVDVGSSTISLRVAGPLTRYLSILFSAGLRTVEAPGQQYYRK